MWHDGETDGHGTWSQISIFVFFFSLTESICLKIRDETAKRTLFWWLLCYSSTLQLYEPKAPKSTNHYPRIIHISITLTKESMSLWSQESQQNGVRYKDLWTHLPLLHLMGAISYAWCVMHTYLIWGWKKAPFPVSFIIYCCFYHRKLHLNWAFKFKFPQG